MDKRFRQIPLSMTTVEPSIAGQEYNQNLFTEKSQSGKYPVVLKACEGYVTHSNLNTVEGVKGCYTIKKGDRCFVMTATALYEIYTNGGYSKIGDVVLSGQRVISADNGLQLVFVDGIKGYQFDLATSVLAEITDEAFYPACSVTEQDGYFIFERTGTKQFFISQNGAVTFDASEFASANGKSDTIVCVLSVSRLLVIFKTSSIEFWFNNGAADFTFGRAQGSFIDHGAYRYTVADISNTIFYVGSDRQVYVMLGYTPAPIGTEGVLEDLKGVNLDDAIGMTYQLKTHTFYVLTIPARNKTWVYDVSMQDWFVRHSSVFGRHVMNNVVRFNNKTLISDFQAGMIYEMTTAVGRDNGDQIIRKCILPVVNIGLARIKIDAFRLDVSVGQGKTTGLDVDPKAVLEISRDNGKSYGPQHLQSLGKKGEYQKRVIWRRLGIADTFTFKITISADLPYLVIGGAWIAI